ncbi:hypothetical protein [Streptomyces sp. NPDC001536]|uniref:tetratricopeptide repeat protein n=1 Tax=Streptomyces sp. NPDC001536 TaxID=3364583 RepID=UPI0036944BC0
MSRLSREKRDQQGVAAQPPVLAAAPLDVLVGPAGASVGGVPVAPVPGEEIHQTVLDHLHRIALATGHPVHATVHDDRIGYRLALRIEADGSSQFTAEPVRTAPPGVPGGGPLPGSGEPGEALRPGASGRDPYAGEPGQTPYSGEPVQASRPTPPPAPGAFPPGAAEATGASGRPAVPSAPGASGRAAADSVEGAGRPALPPAPPAFGPGAAEATGAPAQPALPPAPAAFAEGAAESAGDSPPSAAPRPAEPADQSPWDKPTHLLRPTPEPPTFRLRALPDPAAQEPRDAVPTFRMRAVPEWVADAAPGTVAPPTGQFGPPPVMDAPPTDVPPTDAPPTDTRREADTPPTPTPDPAPSSGPVSTPGAAPTSGLAPGSAPAPSHGPVSLSGPAPIPGAAPTSDPAPTSGPAPSHGPAPTPKPAPANGPAPTPTRKPLLGLAASTPVEDPDLKPTPPRGFDAVAEAVLGDDPATAYDGGGSVFLVGPMARINEAVKEGRITEAAQLAERTVVEASRTLGPEHPEVLRLLELTAYIAYLAGDPTRAFGLSLDLARTRHHARDSEAAYGNVQSAATAWRAVRDPEQGLRMGVELIGLWTELTLEDGPATEDIEQLESARTRMGRLAERARRLNS